MRKLSYHQELMLRASGFDDRDGCGFGVNLSTAAHWRTARSLVSRGLGWIQNGHAQGSAFPGLFFSSQAGAEIAYPDKAERWNARRGR